MSKFKQMFLKCVILVLIAQWAVAEPFGYWLTRDEKDHQPRGLVHLYKIKGVMQGKLKKIFPREGDTGFCRKCPAPFKDKPTKNLVFVWGMQRQSEGYWDSGSILDPKSGKIYSCSMVEKENGSILSVRGYLGISLLGRSQTWERLTSKQYKKMLKQKV